MFPQILFIGGITLFFSIFAYFSNYSGNIINSNQNDLNNLTGGNLNKLEILNKINKLSDLELEKILNIINNKTNLNNTDTVSVSDYLVSKSSYDNIDIKIETPTSTSINQNIENNFDDTSVIELWNESEEDLLDSTYKPDLPEYKLDHNNEEDILNLFQNNYN
uniref:Uncharacterized protein n=1 Tax=Amanita phalloides TaxID=67723 RepID=A0A5Q0N2G1_AMAPH|nr:hypothetical protein [Amanita phalloides]QFZ98685.1 hypothetical protein [Amanita phalloides]WLF85191.1 hypothetical protein [Amanita phalloides]